MQLQRHLRERFSTNSEDLPKRKKSNPLKTCQLNIITIKTIQFHIKH